MKAVFLVLTGAIVSVLAFPPFGPGLLIIPGIALFLWGLRLAENRNQGLLLGAVYGLAFFGGLMWWLSVLDMTALILVPTQASFLAAYGWWLSRFNGQPTVRWFILAVGGWGVMELIRYHFPFGGLEWGAVGYALSDLGVTRFGASAVGTTGLTILVVGLAAAAAAALDRSWHRHLRMAPLMVALVYLAALIPTQSGAADVLYGFVVVQGSTPCPFEHCPPDERLGTYRQHLELTKSIPSGGGGLLTVWPEGSTGDRNADPVLNPEVAAAIGEQA